MLVKWGQSEALPLEQPLGDPFVSAEMEHSALVARAMRRREIDAISLFLLDNYVQR